MVKVVTDSACDIPFELVQKLDITVVPLYIQLGDKTYRDGIDIADNRLYYELARSKEIPKTSAPSPGDFVKVYNNLAMETSQIISIHLSQGYSGTFNAAMLAKSYLGNKCRVEVIDSKSVSVGLGLLVIAAAKAALEGKNLDQIVEIVEQTIPLIHMFGKTSSLAHVLKGKRFRLTRWLIFSGKIATALGVKLLGEIYDGGKIRSPTFLFGQARALNRLKRWAESFAPVKELAIAYSTKLEEAEMLAQRLELLFPREHIVITKLGGVTSTYVGHGTLAIAFISSK